ncbi:MFS transporter [Kutzneria sp. CA-103260]|uniref:MFS transporter n=1 Tax=Kutzneria sp. CA-103260 TaxID=2802641 RepID=UPI001BEEDE20|nr:MFS transporter [Kutzneria sp. CA-103260]QUQ63859.1 major facilitator superfamily transporter [Kutzneria sp. CA-103260]
MGNSAARYRDVFAVGEFRALWLAHIASVVGDQLARVAVSVLVWDRTHSPALSAAAYAVTFLPDLLGGSVLAGVADRYSRRLVMVAADLVRAGVVAELALPGLPLAVQIGALFVVQLLAGPFTAARSAVLPEILDGDRYTVGAGLFGGTYQLALVVGFGGGAAVVTAIGSQAALVVDAGTFALSAALIAVGVSAHRPVGAQPVRRAVWWSSLRGGIEAIATRPQARVLLGIACLCGFYVIPEGLAVAYASQIGVGSGGLGWLLVANPAGTVLGVLVVNRLSPDAKLRWLGPLAVASSALLLPTALAPGLAVTVVLWLLSGVATAHDVVTNAVFTVAVPNSVRGQAVGLAVASLRAAQGVGIAVAGLLAQLMPTSWVIGLAGGLGTVAGVAAAAAWARARAARPADAP